MNNEMLIAGAACLSLVWVESGIPHTVKRAIWGREAYRHRLKPLDCVMCMGFWLGTAGYLGNYFRNSSTLTIYVGVESVIAGAIASVIAVIISKYMNQ